MDSQTSPSEVNTTVGYLLGETNETNVLKDPGMLRRLNQISELPEEDKHCILYTLDGLLQNLNAKQAFIKQKIVDDNII